MDDAALEAQYLRYLARLDTHRVDGLDEFVADRLTYNAEPLTRAQYEAMLADDVAAIPDLRFDVRELLVRDDRVACRIHFSCTPRHRWHGFEPTGARVEFDEHVFYRFEGGRIAEVHSLLDVDAVRAGMR